jgi:hypothetical protein
MLALLRAAGVGRPAEVAALLASEQMDEDALESCTLEDLLEVGLRRADARKTLAAFQQQATALSPLAPSAKALFGAAPSLAAPAASSAAAVTAAAEAAKEAVKTAAAPVAPDAALVAQVMECMGCSLGGAKRACVGVANRSAEEAMEYFFAYELDPGFQDAFPDNDDSSPSTLPPDLCCPILKELFVDPVTAADGETCVHSQTPLRTFSALFYR